MFMKNKSCETKDENTMIRFEKDLRPLIGEISVQFCFFCLHFLTFDSIMC